MARGRRSVWGGWVARASGPARACLYNLVVADIVRMSVSTFALTFTAFCKRTRLFGTYHSENVMSFIYDLAVTGGGGGYMRGVSASLYYRMFLCSIKSSFVL